MRATSKFIIAIGAAALVTAATSAGASAAPIQPRISTDGLSEINLPPDLISSFAADGVTMSATAGAKASTNGSTGYTTVKFPVIKPVKNGVISNRGTLVFTSSITTVKLTLSNPTINFDGGTASTGTMGGILRGLPASMEPYSSQINGTYQAPFDLADLTVTIKKGQVTKKGRGYVRKDVITVTGALSFTDSAASANIFNTALVGPTRPPLVSPGEALGTMASTFSVTVPCTTPKSCQGWTPEPE
jgi:hypothetical protein